MKLSDHIAVPRLVQAATVDLQLTAVEKQHQAACDACQDIFEIFTREFVTSGHLSAGEAESFKRMAKSA